MPPDILACIFVPLHCETLDDGTAEGEREREGWGLPIPLAPEQSKEGCLFRGGLTGTYRGTGTLLPPKGASPTDRREPGG